MQLLAERIDISVISFGLEARHELLPDILEVHILLFDVLDELLVEALRLPCQLCHFVGKLLEPALDVRAASILSQLEAVGLALNSSQNLVEVGLVCLLVHGANNPLQICQVRLLGEQLIILRLVHLAMQSLCNGLFTRFITELLIQRYQSLLDVLFEPCQLRCSH